MTIMAQKLDMKRINWSSKKEKEVIHSGHFMVSDFEAEAQDDEDELAVPVPEESEIKTDTSTIIKTVQKNVSVAITSAKIPGNPLAIDTSLTKLFRCMSIAYRQKLTSPKWNRFKGIRLRWKDKIRLNNVIWRCWHMQFINKQNTLVCQFASPLDVDTHSKPEAIVLEGKYWKRKLNAVTAEYKKWRMFHHNQLLGRPEKYGHDLLTEYDRDWQINSADNMMMVDEDYMGLMSDTLFSTITANQPYAFPDTREIARSANLADFIQPSLVQLQPNLEEFMDIEPLHDFICNRLTTVPEEPVLQPQLASATTFPDVTKSQTINESRPTYQPQYQSQYQPNMWYIVPPYTEPFPESQQPIVSIQQMAQINQADDTYLKDKSTALSTNRNKKMALTAPVIKKVNQQSVMQESQPGNALLAQLLTNNSSYSFMGNEPVKKEEMFMQQFSDLYKDTDYNQDNQIPPPLMKQPSLTNIGGSICPESPKNEPQSLSPLGSVGSPTSPSGKPYREHRRVCHINAEQKRRCNIKNGFDMLHSLIPQLNQNPNAKMSKAAMLQKGAEYIRQLQGEKHQLKQEMEGLRKQIETLNSEICNCQSLLPATGAPISKHRSNKIKDMYRKYVRTRVHDNWKFWILSLICEPLLESFNNNIATSSLDDLYRTTLQWIDQHCTLVDLRPKPLRLPVEARAAVDKKKS